MLRAIRVTNFKAFGETQEIPIRPITLIYGPNSAGKSSILHALAYAHHASRTGELDVHKTELGGQSIDLGGFRQFVHRGNTDEPVVLEFVVEVPRGESEAARWTAELKVTIKRDSDNVVRVKSYSISSGGEMLVSLSARRDDSDISVTEVEPTHGVYRTYLAPFLDEFGVSEEDIAEVVSDLGEELGRIDAVRRGVLPEVTSLEKRVKAAPAVKVATARSPQSVVAALHAIKAIVNDSASAARSALDSLAYIGPLRDYPERDLIFRPEARKAAAGTGSDAWQTLATDDVARASVNRWLGAEHMSSPYRLDANELVASGDLSGPVALRLASVFSGDSDDSDTAAFGASKPPVAGESDLDESLVPRRAGGTVRLNADQARQRGSGASATHTGARRAGGGGARKVSAAELEVEMVPRAAERDGTHHRNFSDAGLERLQPEELQNIVANALATAAKVATNRVVALSLVDCRRNILVSFRDVGLGVSQVLPVLAYAFGKTEKTISIEQPELHLHPALQAELGDLFIESALGPNRNRVILETHSEHLILRLQRRLRHAHRYRQQRDQPEDDSAFSPVEAPIAGPLAEVESSQIAVLYVVPRATGSEVCVLELDEKGAFLTRWPSGFFDERSRERG